MTCQCLKHSRSIRCSLSVHEWANSLNTLLLYGKSDSVIESHVWCRASHRLCKAIKTAATFDLVSRDTRYIYERRANEQVRTQDARNEITISQVLRFQLFHCQWLIYTTSMCTSFSYCFWSTVNFCLKVKSHDDDTIHFPMVNKISRKF